MKLFDIFKSFANYTYKGPEIALGRYTDLDAELSKVAYLNQSKKAFKDEQFTESLSLVFDYLRNDEVDNLQYTVHDQELFFSLYQGSKKIIGRTSQNRFSAIAEIATIKFDHIGLLRRLLDYNYLFQYIRFCIQDEDQLILKFNSNIKDCTPDKVIHGLRELAIQSDKLDDTLVDEFPEALAKNQLGNIRFPTKQIADAKYTYWKNQLQTLITHAETISRSLQQNELFLAYFILDTTYKLDFLIKPEGFIIELLESVHNIYFKETSYSKEILNNRALEIFQKLNQRPKEDIQSEFYDSTNTFGLSTYTPYQVYVNFIQEESQTIANTYSNNPLYCKTICSFLIGYGLYNLGLAKPIKEVLELFYRIHEAAFFNAVGFEETFLEKDILKQKLISKHLKNIQKIHSEQNPKLHIPTHILDFTNEVDFAVSYIELLKHITI